MTTFSRVLLNPAKRAGRKLLTNPQSMHAAVRGAFPPDLDTSTGRELWRVDTTGHFHTLYVVSPEEPDLTHIVEQAGWSTRPAQVVDYEPFLDRLRLGQEWRFRVRANPVRAVKSEGSRGKLRPHVTVAQQSTWLLERASSLGFEVLEEGDDVTSIPALRVTERTDLNFAHLEHDGHSRGRVALRAVQFDGVLRVTDVTSLRSALVKGIGRGKAYGCGLMTLRPTRD